MTDFEWFEEQDVGSIAKTENLTIGKCIYCGATSSLTREHVLPRGLCGDIPLQGHTQALVLQKATCESCRRITSAIEEECLRRNLNYARARLGLKRKDRKPAKMEMIVDLPDGSIGRRDVAPDDVLGPIIIPSYYEAGVLKDRPLPKSPAPCDYHMIVIASATGEILKQSPKVGVELSCSSVVFSRMLAKIALGVAVAQLGVDSFAPTVRNFILRDDNEGGHWVGGFAGSGRTYYAPATHRVRIMDRTFSHGRFIIVEVHLFAEFGAPTNYVVVGTPLLSDHV